MKNPKSEALSVEKEDLIKNLTDKKSNDTLLKIKSQAEESQKQFRAIFENSKDAIGISKDGKSVMCNQSFVYLFGYNDQSEFIGTSVLGQFPAKEHNKIKSYIKKRNAGEEVPNLYVTTGKRKNGVEFPIEVNIGSYKLNNENYTVAIIRDITQRIQAEELFRESSFRYETLLTNTSDGVMTMTPDGKIIEANDSLAKIHGYSVEEILKMNISDLGIPEIKQTNAEKISLILSGKALRFETKHYHKDGHILTFEVSACRIVIGDKIHIMGFERNITEQKQAEKALKLNEEKFRKAFLANPDPVILNRFNDGMCVSINKGFTHILEYREDEAIGKSSSDATIWNNEEDSEKVKQDLRIYGFIENFETKFRSKSGKIIDGLLSASLIELEGVLHIVNIIKDISSRKQIEKELM